MFETEEEMNLKEKELVVIGESSYNLCEGGKGGFGYINSNEKLRIEKNKRAREITNSKYSEKLSEWGSKGGKVNVTYKLGIFSESSRIFKSKWSGMAFAGKRHSEDTKNIIGKKNSINQTGSKNSNYGKMWIYNITTYETKSIPKTNFIPDGWTKGRKRISV